jgi:hypothetical protein
MRRLFLQGIAVLFAATCALFAWAWSEARVAFLVLGIIIGAPLWWFALKFPRPTRSQLHLAAAGAFIAAIAVAVLIPSRRCSATVPLLSMRRAPPRARARWTTICRFGSASLRQGQRSQASSSFELDAAPTPAHWGRPREELIRHRGGHRPCSPHVPAQAPQPLRVPRRPEVTEMSFGCRPARFQRARRRRSFLVVSEYRSQPAPPPARATAGSLV